MGVRSGGGLISRGAGAAITQSGTRHPQTVPTAASGCPCARRTPSGCAPLTCVDELVGLHRVSLTERLPTQFAHEVFNPCRGHTSVTEPQRTRGVLSLTCLGTWRGRRGRWMAGASARSCPRSSENWRLRPAPRGLGQLLRRKGGRSALAQASGTARRSALAESDLVSFTLRWITKTEGGSHASNTEAAAFTVLPASFQSWVARQSLGLGRSPAAW